MLTGKVLYKERKVLQITGCRCEWEITGCRCEWEITGGRCEWEITGGRCEWEITRGRCEWEITIIKRNNRALTKSNYYYDRTGTFYNSKSSSN